MSIVAQHIIMSALETEIEIKWKKIECGMWVVAGRYNWKFFLAQSMCVKTERPIKEEIRNVCYETICVLFM